MGLKRLVMGRFSGILVALYDYKGVVGWHAGVTTTGREIGWINSLYLTLRPFRVTTLHVVGPSINYIPGRVTWRTDIACYPTLKPCFTGVHLYSQILFHQPPWRLLSTQNILCYKLHTWICQIPLNYLISLV